MYVLAWVAENEGEVRVLAVSEYTDRLIEYAESDYAQTRHEAKTSPLIWDERFGADREVVGIEANLLDNERYEIQEVEKI